MAIKDINVMSVINQELAKMDRRGGSRDYVDVVSETMRYAEEHRKRKAERSDDAIKIMDATAGKYNTNYDNASLDQNISRLENYVAKNKGKFDATAMDFYDLTLNNMKDQKALNVDFLQKQEDLPKRVAEINDYLVKRDKDQVWTAENVNELKEMQAPLAKFLGDFKAKHGNRLATKSYEDYNLQLNNMKSMSSHLIQSALDDGHLDEQEALSFITDLEQGNTEMSDRYKKLEDVKLSSQINTLTSKMGDQMTEVQMWKDYLHKDGLIPHPENPEMAVSMKDYIADKQLEDPNFDVAGYKRYVKLKIGSNQEALNITDKSYQTVTTEGSYVGAVAPNLQEKEKIEKKEPDPILTTTQQKVAELKQIRKEKKEYKTALEDATNEYTYKSRDFIQNPSKGLGYGGRDNVLKGMAEEGLISDSDYSRWMNSGMPSGKMWTDDQFNYMEKYINDQVEKLKDHNPDKAINLFNSFQDFKKARGEKLKYMEWNEKANRYVKKKK